MEDFSILFRAVKISTSRASFFATTFHTSQIWRIAKTLVSQNKSMQPFSTLNSCSRMKNISSVGEIMLILKWSYFSCQFFSPAWSEYFLSLVHFLHLKVLNQLVQIIFFFFSFLKVFFHKVCLHLNTWSGTITKLNLSSFANAILCQQVSHLSAKMAWAEKP